MAQTDPGVRGGAPGAGSPIPGLTVKEGKFFSSGQDQFKQIQSVTGSVAGTEPGLGPRFNLNSCAGCHAFPAVGGSSPQLRNPQVDVGPPAQVSTLTALDLISATGPVREVRFKSDGGVHDLFTIVGLPGTPSACTSAVLSQPTFAANRDANNIIFRIPTPTFGVGLIEAISDSTIAANVGRSNSFGITGHANRSGNDGSITRFGWKAQNKSLVIFAGEAYNVEQGITNELFPDDRGEAGVQDSLLCRVVPAAQDHTHYEQTQPQQVPSDVVSFGNFMRFLAPPAPVRSYTGIGGPVTGASIDNGAAQFASVGCAFCHVPSMPTGNHDTAALANTTANLFSDLLVHNMGLLGDGVSQGNAGPNEFRSAPLWGLGQRAFFLHDGRTRDLNAALQAHADGGRDATSEAVTVIENFNNLSSTDRQDILNFLRSL